MWVHSRSDVNLGKTYINKVCFCRFCSSEVGAEGDCCFATFLHTELFYVITEILSSLFFRFEDDAKIPLFQHITR